MTIKETHTHAAPDKLFAGSAQPAVTEAGTIASGAGKLARGTVLGRVTSGGKLKAVDSSKSTGEQVAIGVLAEAVDATSADAVCTFYRTGEYNASALVFGGADTVATHKEALAARGIFIKTATPA